MFEGSTYHSYFPFLTSDYVTAYILMIYFDAHAHRFLSIT